MGYKLTHESVAKVVKYLDQMAVSDDTLVWDVPLSTTPDKAAYILRQGMRAAVALGYSQYEDLIGKFVVKARPGKLIAEKRVQAAEEVFKQSMSRMVLNEVTSLSELIGAVLKHKQDEMFFPEADLDNSDLRSLYKWLTSTDSVKGFLIIKHEQGVTLTKAQDKNISEIAWKPGGLP